MLLAIAYFLYVCLQGRTTAQELLSRVLNAVDVQEADYFGLTSPDDTPMVWPYILAMLGQQWLGQQWLGQQWLSSLTTTQLIDYHSNLHFQYCKYKGRSSFGQ